MNPILCSEKSQRISIGILFDIHTCILNIRCSKQRTSHVDCWVGQKNDMMQITLLGKIIRNPSLLHPKMNESIFGAGNAYYNYMNGDENMICDMEPKT